MSIYVPTTYIDGSVPAISASNLNHSEQGIYNVSANIANRGLDGNLPAISDANALSGADATGFYDIGAGCANVPTTNGTLIHTGRDGRPAQIYIDYLTNIMYTRTYASTAWTAWTAVLTAMASTIPLKNAVVTGSIFTFALSCSDGYTPFKTTSGISGVPTSKGQLDYSMGYVLVSGNYKTIVIVSRTTGIVHTNLSVDGSTWLGWTAYTAVVAT